MRRSVLPLLGSLGLVLGTAACSGSGDKKFDTDGIGVTFAYPAEVAA
jgi:hypothetical protein